MGKQRHRKPLKSVNRGEETRTAKLSVQDNYISVSFRYFQNTEEYPAQSLAQWEQDGDLLDMVNSLVYITQHNISELQSTKKMTLYHSFPDKEVNEFTLPSSLSHDENWGTIRKVGGQKARVAGFLRDNIFYVVYLDKEHKFYKSSR